MYPSTNNVDGNISFTSIINVEPMTTLSSLYNNDVDLSKPFPHYITTLEEDETIYNDLLQQENYPFSRHDTNDIFVHENHGKVVVRDGHDINDGLIDIQLDPKSRGGNTNKRRRTSKKDRHSKIDTARGPRDRRMRLSVDVAKKFFKLQDMLGFDKASKTVEWLLMKSKSGIQELLPLKLRSNFMDFSNNIASSTTSKVNNNQCNMVNKNDIEASTPEYQEKEKGTIGTRVRKSAHNLHSPLAKETRERARARARERTVEKSSSKLGLLGGEYDQCSSKSRPCLDRVIDQYLHFLGPSSTIDNQPEQQISNLQFKQGVSGDNCDNSSLMTANWNPSLFNYQHSGFGAFPHEHHFNDFQILGNLWEGND